MYKEDREPILQNLSSLGYTLRKTGHPEARGQENIGGEYYYYEGSIGSFVHHLYWGKNSQNYNESVLLKKNEKLWINNNYRRKNKE